MSKKGHVPVDLLLDRLAEAYEIESWGGAVYEFINSELNDKPSSNKARYAVAMLLTTMIEEGRRGRSWDQFRKLLSAGAGGWGNQLSPYFNDASRDSYNQAIGIVYEYMACHLKQADAIKAIQEIAPLEESQIKTFIKDHRNEALSKLKIGDHLNFKKIERIRK